MKKTKAITKAVKHDNGKSPLSLIPSRPLFDIADVLAGGKTKYGAQNWRKGMEWTRVLDATMRHLLKWKELESIDDEFGKSHLAHAAVNILFLMEYEHSGIGIDDRYISDVKDE